ncbi:MAG: hydrogenase nickel incorporation protein HypB [Deltaproteobacteria bacterium]|nr:hydrogenase nickel incorporation protein HypB [Deltaproteobacteria bacterium]
MQVKVLTEILKANDAQAARNRNVLDGKGVFLVNVMSSPGSGKTTFLIDVARRLRSRVRVGVIEADVASTVDAEKVAREGIPVLQINTGGGCHIEARQMADALARFPLADVDVLFLENVGNLVCTAGYRLGEHCRIVIASVPEGDDKPYKYPTMFHVVDAVVVSKADLVPHVQYDFDEFSRAVRSINRDVGIFRLSAVTGEGMDLWCDWLLERVASARRSA